MITSNGARVHDQNDQLMYSQNVPQELVQPVIDIVRQDPNIFIHMYQNEDWLLDREDEMLAKFHSESGLSATSALKQTMRRTTALLGFFFFFSPTQSKTLVEYLVTFEQKLKEAFETS